MLIGSKSQLKYLTVDDFILSYDDTPLELVENAKYLGMFINCDIPWDFHVRRLCQSTYYHISLLRRLRRIFPMNLLLQVYKSYIQPCLEYGITLYGCSTQKNIELVQRVQNHAARLIMGNFDYINWRGIDLVKRLDLYTIRERRDYFLTTQIYSWNCLALSFGSHWYAFWYPWLQHQESVYLPVVHKEIYRNCFFIFGWQTLEWTARFCKDFYEYRSFLKRNYRIYKSLT